MHRLRQIGNRWNVNRGMVDDGVAGEQTICRIFIFIVKLPSRRWEREGELFPKIDDREHGHNTHLVQFYRRLDMRRATQRIGTNETFAMANDYASLSQIDSLMSGIDLCMAILMAVVVVDFLRCDCSQADECWIRNSIRNWNWNQFRMIYSVRSSLSSDEHSMDLLPQEVYRSRESS